MINILPANVNHLDFMRECMEELKQSSFDPETFSKTWEDLQACKTYFGFILAAEEKPCGFMGINILPHLHHNGKVAEILELVILPGFRDQKIGEQALEFARHFARQQNCLVLELATSQIRVDARRFYLRNGFRNSHFKLTTDL